MNHSPVSRPFQIRDFSPEDIPDFVEAINLVYPDEPTTIEQMEYWESSYPKDNPRLRAVAESQDGKTIGFAACFESVLDGDAGRVLAGDAGASRVSPPGRRPRAAGSG